MSMSTGLNTRIAPNMREKKGIHSAGANSGRDNVYKDSQYFDDAFYILYDFIMDAYDAWKPCKFQQKRQLITQKLRPFVKEMFLFHVEPLAKRLASSVAQKATGEKFLGDINRFSVRMDLATSVINKRGRSETSKLTSGMGEKAVPFIQDVLFALNEMEGDMVLPNPDIRYKQAPNGAASNYARNALNITQL